MTQFARERRGLGGRGEAGREAERREMERGGGVKGRLT